MSVDEGVVFPLIVPTNEDLTAFEGFLSLQDVHADFSDLWIRISGIPANNAISIKGSKLEMSPNLMRVINGYEWIIQKKVQTSPTVEHFFLDLKNLMQTLLRSRLPELPRPAAYYTGIVPELEAVGWQNISNIDKDLQELTFAVNDSQDRVHECRIVLPRDYPESPPKIHVNLPMDLHMDWTCDRNLHAVFERFKKVIQECQQIWECIDDIDKNCQILEPANPPLSCVYRTLALDCQTSITVLLNPLNPKCIPNVNFRGNDKAVDKAWEKWNKNVGLWDESRLTRLNLQAVLEVELPTPLENALDDSSAECGICYAYSLTDPGTVGDEAVVPEVTCANEKCSKIFHATCLTEWLKALRETRQVFNTLFGNCPHCSEPITVKISSI